MSAKAGRCALLLAAAAVGWYAVARGGRAAAPGPRRGFRGLAARHGYASEEHSVTTDDGYVLTVFRIRRGRRCADSASGTPVLLLNGMLLSSDSWLDAGPGAGLGFLLPDACYDTWLGNVRGSTYAKRHRRLDPRAPAFWQFSADEVGSYDAPATIDYILNKTGSKRLNYFGFSQGGRFAFIMLSERPEYAAKLGVVIAAAPPTDLAHMTSPFRWLLEASDTLEGLLRYVGVNEVFATASVMQTLAERFCRYRIIRDTLCRGFFEVIDSPHPGSVADHTYETLFSNFPSGTSVRSLASYGQALRSGKFRKYDFGERGNMERYGSPQPPEYDLGSVSVPTVILQGKSDRFVTVRDSERLAIRLPRAKLCIIDDPAWNHFDMIYSHRINDSLFPKINEYLLEHDAR